MNLKNTSAPGSEPCGLLAATIPRSYWNACCEMSSGLLHTDHICLLNDFESLI